MCQMTTAAVLGGWTTHGGAEWVRRKGLRIWEGLPDSFKRADAVGTSGLAKIIQAKNGNPADGLPAGITEPSHHTQNTALPSHDETSTPSKPKATSTYVTFSFVRDMSIVGILRGLTVVLGLIALEHVPVSFVETIKSTAPAFTVLFARLILKERTATPVMLTLIPVVAGLILCSASELRFDAIGFAAAVMNNCADCIQNVMSKRMLTHLKPTQLQFYTSVAALALQAPWLLRFANGWVRSLGSNSEEEVGDRVLELMDQDHSLHQWMPFFITFNRYRLTAQWGV